MKRNKTVLASLIISVFSTSFFSHSMNKNVLPAYEVKFTFIGYASFQAHQCAVNDTGKVILSGILQGTENPGPDNPVNYTGTLQLSIHIDICSVKRENDEDKFCIMNVNGSGPVNTQLEMNESAEYGYITINYETALGQFQRSVSGTCDPVQMIEEQQMVPNKTIATIFNGLELTMLAGKKTLGQLQVNKEYSSNMENGIVKVQVLRKIK